MFCKFKEDRRKHKHTEKRNRSYFLNTYVKYLDMKQKNTLDGLDTAEGKVGELKILEIKIIQNEV